LNAQRHVIQITIASDFQYEQRSAPLGRRGLLSGTAVPLRFGEARADKLDQFLRGNRFCPEDHIQTGILICGLRQSAQHNDGKPVVFPANPVNQLRPPAIRHEVIGNDHTKTVTKDSQCRQRTLGGGRNGNLEPRIPQDCFADTELHRIVVNEQNLAQSRQAVTLACVLHFVAT